MDLVMQLTEPSNALFWDYFRRIKYASP